MVGLVRFAERHGSAICPRDVCWSEFRAKAETSGVEGNLRGLDWWAWFSLLCEMDPGSAPRLGTGRVLCLMRD